MVANGGAIMTDANNPNADQSIALEQHSKIVPFLWIGTYTAFLSIITLTLFRFWGRTQMRRQLWKDTVIDGEPLEYVGKGSELFFGFLIAIGTVVLPMVAVIFAAQFLFGPPISFVVLGIVYLALYVLVFSAIFLARRYQLSRTLWRGVRFMQGGSPLSYGLSAFGQLLLVIITLGWYAPVMRLNLARWTWSRAKFGDLDFTYDPGDQPREPVWTSFALAWFGGLLYYLIVVGGVVFLTQMSGGVPSLETFAMIYALAFGMLIPLIVLASWHEAVMLRQITKSISIGGVSLRSRISTWDLIELSITNILLLVFTLSLGGMAAQMRVWRRVVNRLSVTGAFNYAAINQAANRGPRSGEGMADAFDISGGV